VLLVIQVLADQPCLVRVQLVIDGVVNLELQAVQLVVGGDFNLVCLLYKWWLMIS
jgi:hypothetical protein